MVFDSINLITFILLQLSIAELSIQLQISTLSMWIKDILGLQHPYSKKSEVLATPIFWFKLFGNYALILSPLIVVITTAFNIHKFVSSLVNCPYCSGFHIAWMVNLFYFGMDITTSLLFAPLCLVMVVVLDKLHSS